MGGKPDAGDTHPFRQCWQYKLDGGEAVGADASSVYVSVSPAVVRAIDIRSGRDVWSSDLGGSVISNLLVTDESVYVVSGQNTQTSDEKAVFRSLSKQTGITNWTAELPATQRAWLGADAGVVVAVNESGTITAVSISEHSVRWTAHAGGLDAEPVISDGKLLVDSADNRTSVFSAGDGRQSSVFLSKFGATAVSFLFDDKVGIGDERKYLSVQRR